MLNVSVLITFIRTLISWELFTQWWMLIELTGTNKMYTFCILLDSDPYLLSYCPFGKTHATSKMDDFKMICIYENLPISVFFFERREDFSCLLKNPTFSHIIPCAKHVLNTFKLRMLYAHFYLSIVYILFVPVNSISIHHCVNNSHDIKVLMKVIKTKMFNVGFTSQ